MKRRVVAALLPAFFLAFAFAGTGTVPDRPAVDSALSRYGQVGGVITLPPGETHYVTPVNWHGFQNVTVQGHPDGTSCLTLIGGGRGPDPAIDAFIDVRGGYRSALRNFTIRVCRPGVYAAVMTSSLPHQGNHGAGASACLFENITVQYDGGTHNTEVGFSCGPKTLYEADSNNDWHVFRDCRVLGYNFAAYRINGSQCHNLLFDGCSALNYQGNGRFGWAFEFGLYAKLHRCGGAWNNDAFIGMAGNAVQLVVDHCNTEHDGAILHPFGSGASSFSVSFRDCRFALRQREGDQARPAIHFRHAGPLVVSDCLIEEQGRAVPEINMNNPKGIVRLERTQFTTRGDPSGKSIVRAWGPDVDAKSDASMMTVPVGDWRFLKVPADPTKPIPAR